MPIHVLFQLVFKRHTEAEVKSSITVSISVKTQSTKKCNWFDSKHHNMMNEFKHSEVQKNTEQLENIPLIDNLFCIYAVSNLSSKVCLHPVKHGSKPCCKDHDLDPFYFSCCELTTKLQKHFPFVWIWVITATISIIYYAKRHKE